MKTEKQVRAVDSKVDECPLCGCKEDEGHVKCFHCFDCGYLQCCDCDGFYDRARKKAQKKA